MEKFQTLMNAAELDGAVNALARAVAERHGNTAGLALVGIQRRGAHLAERLKAKLEKMLDRPVPSGSLDIALYRDDWTVKGLRPAVGQTRIAFDIEGKVLILVDDVLFSGRTVRAALEALADFGRPGKVELMVLVDRGHRELPIHPDYAALTQETRRKDSVDVLMAEVDGLDEVRLSTKE